MEVPIIGKIGKVKRPLPWIMGLITAGILAVAGGAYFVIDSKTSKIDLAKLTVPVQAQNLTVRITANGSVVPIQSVNLSPKTSGRLAKLFVEQGDKVQQGQRVALMENGDLQARYLQAKANLTKAQASLAEVQAGSRPEEIAQAQARLLQAQARLDEARAGKPSILTKQEHKSKPRDRVWHWLKLGQNAIKA
jgi:HlyD family secretion protein